MILTLCVFSATVIGLVISVLFKPYIKIGKVRIGLYWVITLIGAAVVLISGNLSLKVAIDGITANAAINPLKILALFLSVSLLSLYLGNSGFFDYIAQEIFSKSKNGGIKIFILLYAVVSLLTAFTSNDIVILTFTPPICIFCKKAKLSPVPYLFGEFVAANTFSMALLIGNPTNVYLAQSYGITFFEYFKTMFFPTLFGGAIALLVLILLFRKSLTAKPNSDGEKSDTQYSATVVNKFLMWASIFHLLMCLILLATAEFIGVESYLVCVLCAASLTLVFIVYCVVKEKNLNRIFHVFVGAPYELIPFVLSMFVLVLSLYNCGVTEKLNSILVSGNKSDGVLFGFISAASANLLNNIPMSILFEKIIAGRSVAAVYGAIIGSNIGAFITPVGALAGIMWSKILYNRNVTFPFVKFFIYGTAVAIPTLTVTTLCLLLFV